MIVIKIDVSRLIFIIPLMTSFAPPGPIAISESSE